MKIKSATETEQFYLRYLDRLVKRPGDQTSLPPCVEDSLRGFDFLATFVFEPHLHSYQDYLTSAGFGAHAFASRFYRENECCLALVPVGTASEELNSLFSSQMREHLAKYLEWRIDNAALRSDETT